SIIKAFKNLKDTGKIKEKLILCGKKGWLYEEIFKLIEKSGLGDDIVYLGYITNEEKKWLYKHAEFFIFPSFYEGFGIPLQEAMNYGCPIITSTISSLPEVAGKAGILVKPNDISGLTAAMEKLVKSKNTREKMKEEGFKQIKKLSNEKQIRELIHLFE